MSRLTELITRVGQRDPDLAAELNLQVRNLLDRREFGLNFERHVPETVRLPGRGVRRGDKVIILPPRSNAADDLVEGEALERVAEAEAKDDRLWLVTRLRTKDGVRTANLLECDYQDTPESRVSPVADLIVAASFRDHIYPGLRRTGGVEAGGDSPFHAVINGENFHALEALRFPLAHKVDAIYIDPPYNTRDKDWKYNNDYVDSDDDYKHSKWLAFMERRLELARALLNPKDSVLIISIDEKEYLRLGLLLEQLFSDARIQMVSININTAGVSRPGKFSRSDEYVFFVMLGKAAPQRLPLGPEWLTKKGVTFQGKIRWDRLIRSGPGSERTSGGFYPIYVDPEGPTIKEVGFPLDPGVSDAEHVAGTLPVLPIRKDGSEGRWQCSRNVLLSRMAQGRVRLGGSAEKGYTVYYLKNGEFAKVADGTYEVTGYRPDGSIITDEIDPGGDTVPFTQWRLESHDASHHGSRLLQKMLPGRKFPFPKSLYAVEDCLRFFVSDKPDAVVLDFFAGSGTTSHAVMRLNAEDDGRRRSIVVTNNEVSAEEADVLTGLGMRAGDPEWESLGICEYITKPRIAAAVTGRSSEGEVIDGEYPYNSTTEIGDGLDQNVAFFDLTYEDVNEVRLSMAFEALAPLLWIRAGSRGPIIDSPTDTFAISYQYAILFNIDAAADFLRAVQTKSDITHVFIVCDSEAQYQLVADELADGIEPVRLYESYIRSLESSIGKA